MSTFSSRSSEIQNPFFVFLLSDFSKTTPFFVKSPLRTLVTAGLSRIIGSNSAFHPPDCPRCEKPETARTAGRSGRAGEALSPALSPALLSSASRSLGKRPKFRPFPSGGVHGRLAAESRTQRLTGGNGAFVLSAQLWPDFRLRRLMLFHHVE